MRETRALALIAAPLLLLLVLGGCGGGGQSPSSKQGNGGDIGKRQTSSDTKVGQRATVAGATAGTVTSSERTQAQAGTTMGRTGTAMRTGSSRSVKVQVSGSRETRFSGTCDVGGKQSQVGRQVPKSFTYTVGAGQKLECRIQKRGNGVGPMKVVVSARGNEHVLQADSRWAMLNFTYSGRGFASSINSSVSNSSSSSSQEMNSSSSSSSSSTNSP